MNIKDTSFYKEFLLQKEEIMKHKWYESERAGKDVGFAYALIDWTIKFKNKWLEERKNNVACGVMVSITGCGPVGEGSNPFEQPKNNLTFN